MKQKLAIYRVIDANLNRLREGLRVVEEVVRLCLDNEDLTRTFKDLRAKLQTLVDSLPDKQLLLLARQVGSDVGRKINSQSEFERQTVLSLYSANLKRTQEASRVLEEFSKRINKKLSQGFKEIRFKLYELEKLIFTLLEG